MKSFLANVSICIGFLLFLSPVLYAGFIAGTLVKTPDGYVAIEQLVVDSIVYCSDDNGNLTTSHITHILNKSLPSYVAIVVDNLYIGATLDQQFYLTYEKRWSTARSLTVLHELQRNCVKPICPTNVCFINQAVKVYDIGVARYHNFYVTPFDIKAHNFVPIMAGFSFLFGAG